MSLEDRIDQSPMYDPRSFDGTSVVQDQRNDERDDTERHPDDV